MPAQNSIDIQLANLNLAAATVERAAYSLAGHVSATQVAHLMQLAAELERVSGNLEGRPNLQAVP